MSKPIYTRLPNGRQEWRLHGLLHRLDGPAVTYPDGTQAWYQKDQYHRLDGPAIIYINGSQKWFQNGNLHRLSGPAVIRVDARSEEWYVHGTNITHLSAHERLKYIQAGLAREFITLS